MNPQQIGALARLALELEVGATPKPGLVDEANCGAHKDMNIYSFLASASALEPHFARFAQMGFDGKNTPEPHLFAALRRPGMEAERDMLAATGGVNTHRGALFSLGILCAAAGRQLAKNGSLRPHILCRVAAKMTAGVSLRELAQGSPKGARGEAESGFASVRRYGLPALKRAKMSGASDNDARVRALISLMARVTDTNVLNRRGERAALELKDRCLALSRRFSIEKVRALDRELIAQNISPGGCADLLAVCIFMQLLNNSTNAQAF